MVKSIVFRVLFAIIIYYNLDINKMIIKTAILYRMINQFVYVVIPIELENSTNKKMVCKLLKALHDLK